MKHPITLFLGFYVLGVVYAKDCERACRLFTDSLGRRELEHEAREACKKHNITPRPTTIDICLSTFKALQKSTCMNVCDGSPLVEDACGAIAGSTWIPKHNAYRSCKTGYKSAVRHVPGVLNAVANKFEDLRELLVDGKEEVWARPSATQACPRTTRRRTSTRTPRTLSRSSCSRSPLTTGRRCSSSSAAVTTSRTRSAPSVARTCPRRAAATTSSCPSCARGSSRPPPETQTSKK